MPSLHSSQRLHFETLAIVGVLHQISSYSPHISRPIQLHNEVQPVVFFLTDENISGELSNYLKNVSLHTQTIWDAGLGGSTDLEILGFSQRNQLVIVTQDSDFGTLIYTDKIKFVGIIYLRPGHLSTDFHTNTIKAIINERFDLNPPFILVAENNGKKIKMRLRHFD